MNKLHSPENLQPGVAATLLAAALLSACATERSFEMSGGRTHERVVITENRFPEALEPHIADAPKAHALYKERVSESEAAMVVGLGSLLTLGAASGLSAVMNSKWWGDNGSGPRYQTLTDNVGTDAALLGSLLGSSIVLYIVARIIEPGEDDWAEVLNTYNEERPDAAWSVPFFGVTPTVSPVTASDPGLASR
jgi:hypothetical protein